MPSKSGTLISLIIIGTVLAYGIKKFEIMVDYTDTTYQTRIDHEAVDETTEYTFEDTHFAAAIALWKRGTSGLVEYLTASELQGYLKIVAMEFFVGDFDQCPDSKIGSCIKHLDIHICT